MLNKQHRLLSKKTSAVALLFGLSCALIGLSVPLSANNHHASKKVLNVIAVTDDLASIARSVGGEHVKVTTLVKGSHNLHNITPKPSMAHKLKHADVLIRIGMKQDSWVDGLIQTARNKRVLPGHHGYIDASVTIKKLEVPKENISGKHGDVHIDGNPHYNLDPKSGILIAEQIMHHFSKLSPGHQVIFESNTRAFKKQMEANISKWHKQLEPIRNKGVHFVSYHNVWPYFFERFGLKSLGQLEPLPGIPPTPSHLNNLKKSIRRHDKKVIVMTADFYPENQGRLFAKQVGAPYIRVPVLSGESGAEDYSALFDLIIEKITK